MEKKERDTTSTDQEVGESVGTGAENSPGKMKCSCDASSPVCNEVCDKVIRWTWE